jgi:paraquat-inducible protein B
MAGTNAEMTLTLQALRKTIEETHGLFTTDSGIGYGMEQALASFREAAEALRVLAIALERNPDMLIRGKKPGGN